MDIEWYEITPEQFPAMLTGWVADPTNAEQRRFEEDGKECVIFSKSNDPEFGLLTMFDPATQQTSFFASLATIALSE